MLVYTYSAPPAAAAADTTAPTPVVAVVDDDIRLTTEELVWNAKGKLMTNGPASYKIPAIADMPIDLRVKLVENRKNPEQTVFHSKAVGEPPFMLGIAAFCAIKDAVASLADYKVQPQIDAPATPERVLWGVEQLRKLKQSAQAAASIAAEPA